MLTEEPQATGLDQASAHARTRFSKAERRERVLDLWREGLTAGQIAERVDSMPATVGSIVLAARARGDCRAVRRAGGIARTETHPAARRKQAEELRLMRAARRRRQLALQFPSSLAELIAAARAADVPVMQLPPSVHAGWRPSWF